MKVTTTAIVDGKILDKYGKRGSQFNINGTPTYSWSFKIEDEPEGTVCFAAILDDIDSFPPSGGFVWIHWTIANLKRNEVLENESQTATDFLQGANSSMSVQGGSQSRKLSSCYGGMAPPDAPHEYALHVYALDKELNLENGFMMNEMLHKIEDHVLAKATVKGIYDN